MNEVPDVSRRSLVLAGGIAAAGIAGTAQGSLTAGQVIERIKTNVGIPWRAQTVDNIIAGSAEMPVKGIATTMMATLDVVQRAAAAGRNMVITHEPTYYSHQDRLDALKEDALYKFKLDFLTRNGMVVFHFHDHWHGRRPDGIAVGMSRELGWEKYADPQNPRLFVFPETTLARFSRDIQTRLKIRVMRVVGNPEMRLSRVLASWGNLSQMPGIPYISRPDVDVLIVGETIEWELVEYAQDLVTSGRKKALIILGHVVSEQADMKFCAEWLKSFVTEVPVEFIPSPEPYWHPEKPAA